MENRVITSRKLFSLQCHYILSVFLIISDRVYLSSLGKRYRFHLPLSRVLLAAAGQGWGEVSLSGCSQLLEMAHRKRTADAGAHPAPRRTCLECPNPFEPLESWICPDGFKRFKTTKKNQMERPDRRARLARVNYLSDQNSTHENRLANGNIVVGTGRGHNHAILSAICNHFCPRRERTGRLKLQNFFTVTSPGS